MRSVRPFARTAKRKKPLGCLTRNSLRGPSRASSQNVMAPMSGLVGSGLQHPEGSFNSTIVNVVASLLLAMGVVAGGGALADQRLDFLDEMVPQRPGMKTEEDHQRFVQE